MLAALPPSSHVRTHRTRPRSAGGARRLLAAVAVAGVLVAAGCSSNDPTTASAPNGAPATVAPAGTGAPVGAKPPTDGKAGRPVPGTSGQIANVKAAVTDLEVFANEGDTKSVGKLQNPWLYDPEQPQSLIPRSFLVKQDKGAWIEVYTGEPPSESTTWIRTADVDLAAARYRIEVNVPEFNLKAYEGDKLILDAPVAVGAGERPTLAGLHYVNVILKTPDPSGFYGPYAMGISSYSTDPAVLAQFPKGQAAIHGTNDPSSIGRAASNGCIRLSNDNINLLATLVPLGTPVVIKV